MAQTGPAPQPDETTVLVADDDGDIRSLIAATLRRAGFSVVEARDGDEAVRLAVEHYPQVVVLDLMMPHVDGYEITRRMREHRALGQTAIILVTALTSDADMARGFEVGADDYIRKPFGPAELRSRVEAAALRRR